MYRDNIDYEYQDAMADAKYDAMMDEHYDTSDCMECPECEEMTLRTGQTQSYYVDGMKECPDETPVYCLNCGYEDCIW